MVKKSITKKYNINGPVNIIRLTNGEKIVYIFGDLHINLEKQTECVYDKNIESIDIDKFFRKIFKKNPDKKFDFFYEGYYNLDPKIDSKQQNEILDNQIYTKNYFSQIIKLVFNNIDIIDNKIHTSKQFHNVRLHYFNFRNIIPHYIYLMNNSDNFYNLQYSNNYNNIISSFMIYNKLFIEIKDFLDSDKNSYIKKIKSIYNNKEIGEKIINVYNILIIDLLNNILKLINDTIKYIKNTPKLFDKYISINDKYELNKLIYININIIDELLSCLFSNLTDIYLVRRLLDKNYINNCIIFTGAYHMIDIVYILIKYFDFKITHIANSDKEIDKGNIDNVNTIIKKKDITNYDDIKFFTKYFYNNNYQCSNLFNFPDNLE